MRRLSNKLVLVHGSPAFFCPGCKKLHITVGSDWNGDMEHPTFEPHIDREGCSVEVYLGLLVFSENSKHDLAGQYAELPDLPDWIEA